MIEEKKVPEKLTVTNFVRISSDTWSGIASNYSFEAGHPHLSHGVRDGVDYIRADIHESALAESRQEVERLRKAIDVFARIYRLNKPLGISDDVPLREVLPGLWPVFGDCRQANEALHPTQPAEGR